jgi:hypothetical protein
MVNLVEADVLLIGNLGILGQVVMGSAKYIVM